jgi:hypothetical protein
MRVPSLVGLSSWIALYYAFYAGYYKVYETWYYAPVGLGLAIIVSCIIFKLCRWAANPKKYARLAVSTALALVALQIAEALYGYFSYMTPSAFQVGTGPGISFLILAILGFGTLALFCWLATKHLLPRAGGDERKFLAPIAMALMAGYLNGDLRNAGSRAALVRTNLYTEAGKWLNEHVRPGVSVGYSEIGFIGWNAPNVVIQDPLGLGSPAPREFISKGDEVAGPYSTMKPDIIVGHPLLTPPVFSAYTAESWPKEQFVSAFPWWYSWFSSHYALLPGDYRQKLDLAPNEAIEFYYRKDISLKQLLQ